MGSVLIVDKRVCKSHLRIPKTLLWVVTGYRLSYLISSTFISMHLVDEDLGFLRIPTLALARRPLRPSVYRGTHGGMRAKQDELQTSPKFATVQAHRSPPTVAVAILTAGNVLGFPRVAATTGLSTIKGCSIKLQSDSLQALKKNNHRPQN